MKTTKSGVLAVIMLLPVFLFTTVHSVSLPMQMETEFISSASFDVEITWDSKQDACLLTATGQSAEGFEVIVSDLEGKTLAEQKFEGEYIDMHYIALDHIKEQVVIITVIQGKQEVSAMRIRS